MRARAVRGPAAVGHACRGGPGAWACGAGDRGERGGGAARAEQRSGEERGEEGRRREENGEGKRKWKKRKRKEKEKEGERKREIRGEPFGGDHDAGRARAAVAAACRGFGGKWRARIEGNRGTEWRLDPGVGTGEKISGVRV